MTYDFTANVSVPFVLDIWRDRSDEQRDAETPECRHRKNFFSISSWRSLGRYDPDQR